MLDIGTGTGIHALIAAQLGARHVWAIEPGDAIQVAREAARANGFEQRITFIQGLSDQVELPEPVDVIVSDMRGVLPLFANHIGSLIDARDRLLAPGGVLIPLRDDLLVAPVESADLHEEVSGPWRGNGLGLDLAAGRALATQTVRRRRIEPDALVAEPAVWTSLDYGSVSDPDADGAVGWTMERKATVHGFALWFDATLVDGVGFSNAPGRELVYGTNFLPLTEPLDLATGDRLELPPRRPSGGRRLRVAVAHARPRSPVRPVELPWRAADGEDLAAGRQRLRPHPLSRRPDRSRRSPVDGRRRHGRGDRRSAAGALSGGLQDVTRRPRPRRRAGATLRTMSGGQ